MPNRFHFSLLIAIVAVSSVACAHKASMKFEPEARAITRKLGLSAARHPKIVIDPAGDTLFVLGVVGVDPDTHLMLFVSSDGGDTFEPGVPVSDPTVRVDSHGENSPVLVFGSEEKIYSMWEEQTGERTDLMFANSLDFGSSFEKAVRVSDQETPTYSGYSSLAGGPNGLICSAWLDFRDEGEHPQAASVYFSCSMDGGITFAKNIKISSGACPCCRPAVVFGEKGEILVFWRQDFPGSIRDMVAATSNDNGKTFNRQVRVAVDGWKLQGCPDSGPSAVRAGHRIYAAWLTEAARDRTGVRLAWTDDGGKTFSPVVTASQNILDANHPSLAVEDDGRTLLVFQGRDPLEKAGWTPARPFAVEINKEGERSEPTLISAGSQPVEFPTVATGSVGRAFFAWTESTGGKPSIMLARARSVPRW